MDKQRVVRWMVPVGIVITVLLIVAFPFYYAFIRNAIARSGASSKTSTGNLSLLDKVELYLEHELNKRLRRLGIGMYRLTRGRIAHLAGAPADVLLLTTRGRKSGREHTVMLQGFRDGADLVVAAANSGLPSHPDWFYNLKASPTAQIEVGNRILQVHAEELPPDEASAFWPHIVQIAPSYARFQSATSRPIPLVRLVPIRSVGEQTSPGSIPSEDTDAGRLAASPGPIERLSSTVADPSAPAYLAGVMIVEAGPLLDAEGRLRLTEIQRRIERRLSHLPQLRRRAHVPGFLQGRPVWVDAAGFAIERHVRQGAVDAPGGEAEVLAAAERILRDHLDQSQPPWELWFLTGVAGGRLAVLLKLHHAIADGLGTVQIVMTLFDTVPDTPDPPPALWTPAPPPSRRSLLANNLAAKATVLARAVAALRHPRQLAVLASDLRRSITMGSQAPVTSFNRPVPVGASDQVRVLHMELEPARAAAHAADAKVNDVLLDIAAGGLRALLLGRGEQMAGLQLFSMVPVTLRSSAQARALGNQAGFMIVPLPVGEPDDQQRLRQIAAATRRAKAEQHPAYFQVLGALSVLSAKVAPALMERQRYMNLIVTNVPGPTVPLYLFGARILDVIPLLGGFLGGNVSICFCALSYAGRLNLTMIADATIIPDADLILQGMRRTWVELAGAAQERSALESAIPTV